jgi:hypothetical protein
MCFPSNYFERLQRAFHFTEEINRVRSLIKSKSCLKAVQRIISSAV